MHLWTLRKWEQNSFNTDNKRKGLYTRFDSYVNTEVKAACKAFAKWLRKEYDFPKRVNISFKSSETIKALDGEMVSATCSLDYDMLFDCNIRIAVGDYPVLLNKRGRDNALAIILRSVAHELTHYYQWINNITLTEIGYERQSKQYADFIVDEYSYTREHP